MKKSFYLLFVVFLFGGCQPRYLGKFPIPDDLRPVLKNGDTLCYKDSITNRIDTFVITVFDYFRTVDESGDYERISVSYKNKNMQDFIYTRQSKSGIDITVSDFNFNGARFETKYPTVNNVIISGINYPEIYCSKEFYLPDSIPNKVFYTPQQGILRYDYRDGRHYDRITNK